METFLIELFFRLINQGNGFCNLGVNRYPLSDVQTLYG